jgi:ubiquinone/menaquinone biosynthesis C-methylase UbiE
MLSEIGPGKRVLDVPIGTGRFVELYKDYREEVTGIDSSEDMLAQAKARAEACGYEVHLHRGDIRRIPYVDNHFDLVVCMHFFSWVDHRGLVAVLRELTRVSSRHVIVDIIHFLSLRELDPSTFSGLRESARQLAKRVRLGLGGTWSGNAHSLRTIDRLFASNGLRVVQSVPVQRRSKDGTESVVYWLTKSHVAVADSRVGKLG